MPLHHGRVEWCIEIGRLSQMSRTNIDIDETLIRKAIRLTGARSKREAVDIALRRLVEKSTLYRALRRARGKLPWAGDPANWRAGRSL